MEDDNKMHVTGSGNRRLGGEYKSYIKNYVQLILFEEGTEPGTFLYSKSFQSVHECFHLSDDHGCIMGAGY